MPFYKLYVTEYEPAQQQVYDELESKAQTAVHALLEKSQYILLQPGESITWQTDDQASKLVIQMDYTYTMECVTMLALLKILRQGFVDQGKVRARPSPITYV